MITYCSYVMRLNKLNDVLGMYDNLLLQFNELSDFRYPSLMGMGIHGTPSNL